MNRSDTLPADKKKEAFHNKHETFTERAYRTPGLLPDRYVLVLTNLCNLRCHFCFQEKTPRKNAMRTEDWLRFVAQLPDYARVTLTGGEPLAFKGFREVFRYVAERYDCNMITNGVLLNEELIDFLLEFPRFRVLSISIDNIGNTLRDIKPSQWQRTESMMRLFARKKQDMDSSCVLEAKTVVLDENAGDLLAIHKYCMEDLHCDHHSYQFLKGSPIQHADYMFDYDAIFSTSKAPVYRKFDLIRQQLELIRQYNLRTGYKAFLHPKIGSLVSKSPLGDLSFLNVEGHRATNFLPCKFPWSSVHINSDGMLFPCLAIAMGNVKDTSLADIINGEAFERFREEIRRSGSVEGCNRCGWLRPRNNAQED